MELINKQHCHSPRTHTRRRNRRVCLCNEKHLNTAVCTKIAAALYVMFGSFKHFVIRVISHLFMSLWFTCVMCECDSIVYICKYCAIDFVRLFYILI